jgi:diacylglycerol kinase
MYQDLIMIKKSKNLLYSFYYAGRGLKDAFAQEPNLRIHVLNSIIVLAGAIFLKFSYLEFAIVALTIAMVIILELLNTTLETLVDIVSPEIREKARIAKDVSAAGVLLAATAAVVIVLLLYVPKILILFF